MNCSVRGGRRGGIEQMDAGAVNWFIPIQDKGANSYEITYLFPPNSDAPSGKRKPRLRRDDEYISKKISIGEGDIQAAEFVGEALFAFLFGGAVGASCLELWLKYANENKRVLRLILEIDAELADEPWEYLHHDTYEFLGLNQSFSIVRCFRTEDYPDERALSQGQDPAVLVLVANPPVDELITQPEVDAIEECFPSTKTLEGNEATVKGVVDRDAIRYNIIHFIGHSDEGLLQLTNELVSAGQFAIALSKQRSLQLAVLTSCDSSSLSWRLIEVADVPTVVAMRFDMFDMPAAGFTRDFYRHIAEGTAIDIAVKEARRILFASYRTATFWGYPTITIKRFKTDSVDACAALQRLMLPRTNQSVAPFTRSNEPYRIDQQDTVLLRPITPIKSLDELQQISSVRNNLSQDLGLSGEQRRAHVAAVSALTFVSNTDVLISGDRSSVLHSWKVVQPLTKNDEPLRPLAGSWTGHRVRPAGVVALMSVISAAGSLVVSAGEDGLLFLWDWMRGTPITSEFTTASATVGAIVVEQAGNALALITVSGKVFYLPNIAQLLAIKTRSDIGDVVEWRESGGAGSGLAFSPDGEWLAAATQRTKVQIWGCNKDRGLAQRPLELGIHGQGNALCVDALNSHLFVVGTETGQLILWDISDTRSGSPYQVKNDAHKGKVKWVAAMEGDRLLSVSPADVALWRLSDNGIIEQDRRWSTQPGIEITSVATDKRTLVAVGLSSGSILLISDPMESSP